MSQGKRIKWPANTRSLYDVARNEGGLHLNTSVDTSEFCRDSIAHGWIQHGRPQCADAHRLLLRCDGGGANASNRHVFKEALQKVAQRRDCGRITRLPESDVQQD